MDIEAIARKLEPLMPREVRHWMRARDLADPELKTLIEKQIVSQAHKHLGNFRRKPLLSLPPERVAKGEIQLGKIIYEKDKWDFGLSHQEISRHVSLLGMSGAGKTNAAVLLAAQLVEQGVNVLVLDWKRTYRSLIQSLFNKLNVYTTGRSLSLFPFNPFISPPGLEFQVYANYLIDSLATAYTLGDGARWILQKALGSLHRAKNTSPTIQEVIEAVKSVPTKERKHGWKISALRALDSVEFAELGSKDSISQEKLVSKLINENNIIELDSLSDKAKKFLIPLLCLWIYHVKLNSSSREKLSLAIFLEEAHHVVYRQEHRSKESVMNSLLRQSREIGIGFVIIDQHPHLISSAALGNSYTSIVLSQKDPTDINKAGALSLLDEKEKKFLSQLRVGQGIVKLQDRWKRPFLVQFPLAPIKKGAITDSMLSRWLKGDLTFSQIRERVGQVIDDKQRSRNGDYTLEDGALALLKDVMHHPENDGVDIRYTRLSLSGAKGHRLKQQLIGHELLKETRTKVGRAWRTTLAVTGQAKSFLGMNNMPATRESFAHAYWKWFYAQLYQEHGYQTEYEAIRNNKTGQTDLLATRESESVAVEVETGQNKNSDTVENVLNNLKSGYKKVLVVATNDTAFSKVKSALDKAGLIIPGRVKVVLRDQF